MGRQEANEQFLITSFLDGSNAAYIEQLYARYQEDPSSVSDEWQAFFKALADNPNDVTKAAKGASWQRKNWPIAEGGDLVNALDGNWGVVEKAIEKKVQAKVEATAASTGKAPSEAEVLQATRDSVRAIMMIRAYRMRGHLHAKLDPLGLAAPVDDYNELSPTAYGFTEADYGRKIFIDNVLGLEYATIPQMLDILQRTYCSTLGVEFMHISNPEEKAWIQERIEGPGKGVEFTPNGKKAILQKLIEAEGFEQFIDVKYKGTKRFGLDGGESLIPALEQIIKRGGQEGLEQVVLGMAHRGRLNVLTNVMHKPHRAVFHEFKGGSFKPDEVEGSGDVKYHLGASSDREFDGNKVHLSLTANHLEIVDPVVMGKARAKQDQLAQEWEDDIIPLRERVKVLPLLLHGDAAFALAAQHQKRTVAITLHHGFALWLGDIDGAEPSAPGGRFAAGAIKAASDRVLLAEIGEAREETRLMHVAGRCGWQHGCERGGGNRIAAGMFRACGDQQRAAVFDVLGDVVVVKNRQHTAMLVAIEDDQVEIVDLFDEQFACREGDQRQFVDRRTILLFRRAQNGEMHQVDRGVGLQEIAPGPFAGMRFARDEQHAQVLADAVDDVDGAVVRRRHLARNLRDGEFHDVASAARHGEAEGDRYAGRCLKVGDHLAIHAHRPARVRHRRP